MGHSLITISIQLPDASSFLSSETHSLIKAVIFLLALMTGLLVYILISLLFKNRRERLRKRLSRITDLLIQRMLFNEDQEFAGNLTSGAGRFLKLKTFRNLLIEELVRAKKNFSGVAANNLQLLYQECDLSNDSYQKLVSRRWYLKAMGIQELAEMGQNKSFDLIFELTNHSNEQVRMEAQNAVVKFSGLTGLNFLDFLTYPLSDWQQIQLINQLGDVDQNASDYIRKWIGSSNNSVVIFSLKLAARYHHFELHDRVALCLTHPSEEVRYHAIKTLKEIFDENTSANLVKLYDAEGLRNQLVILEVLQNIGTEKELPFLEREFTRDQNEIRLAAGRAIARVADMQYLESRSVSTEYPWTEIIQQIKGELRK
ncbi:HEAT repeat domain-containing protein [Desertivirga arenae]|uniref:HEAT repeat domain-containing protein n=1 Tax=Desertivirga arenae TaxID=2810309 RepID=UPI001A977EBB|nr:HEAT repeat domain-containing protein [Pedobacter sp. SYSU D00823]